MIRRFSRGDNLTEIDGAARLNELVDAVNALTNLRLGPGLEGRIDARSGLLLRLAGGLGKWGTLAKITAVHGPANWNGTDPVFPSEVKYDLKALDEGFTMEAATPVYGRQVENDECKIHPAKVGDLCWVWFSPRDDGDTVGELELFRENVARGPCTR